MNARPVLHAVALAAGLAASLGGWPDRCRGQATQAEVPSPAPVAGAGADADPPQRDALDAQSGAGRVPAVPDGTPEELLRFIEQISDPAAMPRSRGRRRYYLKKSAAAFIEVADRILAQVSADDPLRGRAIRLKLDGFALLDEMGDDGAKGAHVEFVRTLIDSPDPTIARAARRMVLAADVDALFAARSAAGAERLVADAAALLEADPDDSATARVATQLATDLAGLAGAEQLARRAHETFVPLLAASGDARVHQLGDKLAAGLRRLAILGKPLVLDGMLLDGRRFEQKSLAGKVVLVDFWATWCGPCVAEMPNIRAQYEKYHDRGFEVVGISLDDDRAAVAQFVEANGLPWPVILDGRNAEHSVADRYEIKALPTLFLIGRDGNVLSLLARGKDLETLLAEQFPAPRP
jgi:thiol-disulfide isomerase/thioredoxin